MVFRYLRTLEGVSPPLSLTHLSCQTTAKAFIATRTSLSPHSASALPAAHININPILPPLGVSVSCIMHPAYITHHVLAPSPSPPLLANAAAKPQTRLMNRSDHRTTDARTHVRRSNVQRPVFDRMFSLGVRGSGTDTAPLGARVAAVAGSATSGPRRHFLYCSLHGESTQRSKRSREQS